MTKLTFETRTMPGITFGTDSSLPPVANTLHMGVKVESVLDETDGLFLNYGYIYSPFPYRVKDNYTRELNEREFPVAVLENEFLRAEFMTSLGGRLWSLFDKKNNKELLFSNPVFRPGNLATRNAWCSGGVEWNCGTIGHTPYTCSPVFTAETSLDDGTPVLRMYAFERVRCVVYQMDFFLPDGSHFLYARIRIVNSHNKVIPMYWWSNIAVPEVPGGRVVSPAHEVYTDFKMVFKREEVPILRGTDITYPKNHNRSGSFFLKLDKGKRKYITHLDPDGYGLVQASTERLLGRKLFVWGQGAGGKRWQEFLSGDGCDGNYVEIQAGITPTQGECLPMPPNTAWEWLEAYGAMNADGKTVHGDWSGAINEVESHLSRMLPEEELDRILCETACMAKTPANKPVSYGDGWAALENLRRKKAGSKELPAHLDFGCTGEEQEPWKQLLENGCFPECDPVQVQISWMDQPEWTMLLEKAIAGSDKFNWTAYLHLAAIYLIGNDSEKALCALETSMRLQPSCWTMYIMAKAAESKGNKEEAAVMAMRAAKMKKDDVSLAKEAMKMLYQAEQYDQMLALEKEMPPEIASHNRIKLLKAFAILNTGDINGAEELFYEGGGIVIADIREGETTTSELWFQIEEAKAAKENKTFSRRDAVPPVIFDFRMFTEKDI